MRDSISDLWGLFNEGRAQKLKSLEIFASVAGQGSITKAAHASNIALTAASRRLTLLE
jgi:hypothetical protein